MTKQPDDRPSKKCSTFLTNREGPRSRRRLPPTLRWQLLMTVNGVMAVLVVAFLLMDYRRELSDRWEQKQVALQEEAKTLLPAVLRLHDSGAEAVQEYLDAVCRRMRDAESPQHHIAVRTGTTAFQSTAHGRASSAMLRAMERSLAAQGRGTSAGQDLIVGSAGTDRTVVYVSEDAEPLRNAVFGQILWRLVGMLAMGVIAAVIVSTILLRVVAKPVKQLVAAVTEITHGNFGVQSPHARSRELSVLSAAIDKMSETLRLGAERRQSEMAKAREIQEHLLPALAEVPGLRLAALYRPASDVAGDYYDVVTLSDGSWLLCVADVCGHGVPAAMSAAMLKALLLHAAEHHVRPSELLQFVNERFIALSPPGLFASMLLLRWRPTRGVIEYASAGHEPAYFQTADGAVTRLDATGLFVGIEPTANWSTQEFSPQRGERLLITTDGVSEAMNAQGELFGRQRLQSQMAHLRTAGAESLVEHLDSALREHRGSVAAADDTTILAVEFIADASAIRAHGAPVASGMSNRRQKQGVLH